MIQKGKNSAATTTAELSARRTTIGGHSHAFLDADPAIPAGVIGERTLSTNILPQPVLDIACTSTNLKTTSKKIENREEGEPGGASDPKPLGVDGESCFFFVVAGESD